ncbi:hypothetical protein ACVW1A_007912 [Bradyrhizobium sp. LB1.3]
MDHQIGAAFRELVDSVIVMPRKAGEPYTIETRGRLAALLGTKGTPIGKAAMSAKSLVPAEGIEPPTFGLQNLTDSLRWVACYISEIH